MSISQREMSLVEGYVSASDFFALSKIGDLPVELIREIIRSDNRTPVILQGHQPAVGSPGEQQGLGEMS